MYKPLSLVISKADRSFDRPPLFKAPSFLAQESVEVKRPAKVERIVKATPMPSRPVQHTEFPPMGRPRCIKSYRSDRMAIYDETHDTFHAYSVTEAISQSGLSFQEAVDWVDDRLVLVGKGMGPGSMAIALSLVFASGLVAVLLIAAMISFLL
ncbi:MAG: hypothetical protein AAF564_19705 [Bacteroidota bacterium]